jgi:hypothetical protein
MKGELTLTISGKAGTQTEQIIRYLRDNVFDSKAVATSTLAARFIPFILDRDNPCFEQIAVQCAIECEAWAKAIREYAGLPAASVPVTLVSSQIAPAPLSAVNSDDRLSSTQTSEADVNDDNEENERDLEIEDEDDDEDFDGEDPFEYSRREALAEEMMGDID